MTTDKIRAKDNARYNDERRKKLNAARRARGGTKYANMSDEEKEKQKERQRGRRAYDKAHGKSSRQGKDIDHKKPLKRGGKSSLSNMKLADRKSNRAAGGAMSKPKKK